MAMVSVRMLHQTNATLGASNPQPEHVLDCACSMETSIQFRYTLALLANYLIYRTKSIKQMYAVLLMLGI